MMKKAIFLFIICFSFLPLMAQNAVRGEIIYIEGDVNVSRKGEFLPFYEVDMGLSMEEEDIVRTGPDGYVEIELTYPGQGSLLKIQSDTVFFFEKRENSGKSTTRVNLICGTIGLKVNKLANNESMNVETQSAVMGIRGTEFEVNKAPTGEVLVTCAEGKVSCATPAMETFSEPGVVCLQNDGQDFIDELISVGDLDEYSKEWWDFRIEALAKLGPMAVEYYLGRYERQILQFNNAWEELSAQERLFREYESLIERGETPTTVKATRDKISLTSPIIKMRSTLPIMEEIFYTLLILEEYQSRGLFDASTRSLKDFNRKKESVEKNMVKSRYYLALYGRISQFAGGGSGSALDDMLSGSTL